MAKKPAQPAGTANETPAPAAPSAGASPAPQPEGGATVPATTSSAPEIASAAAAPTALQTKPDTPTGTATFELVSSLLADGQDFAIGEEIDLTFRQFVELKAAGVISGEWPKA